MIRVTALCLFRDGGRILVAEEPAAPGQPRFARPLGGGVEQGETSRAAIAREIREELGQAVTSLRLLGVLENLFTYQGKSGHEIVFVYDGRFVDESVYRLPELPIVEAGHASPAVWRSLDSFGPDCPLVPAGLMALLGR
ncbi:MAG: NUDIX hydrolase [Planctomycetota bacterium]|nr:NUDIX hydrolase [Planctomycetota bacterium]